MKNISFWAFIPGWLLLGVSSHHLVCLQRGGNNAFKVFVGGIAANTTEADLRSYFEAYGMVSSNKMNYSTT